MASRPASTLHRLFLTLPLAACYLLLASCGFQLRGGGDLPPEMEKTFIKGLAPNDTLYVEMVRTLRANGLEVVESEEQATALLHFTRKRNGRRVLTVGSGGKVREYEINTTVTFQAKGIGNEFRVKSQTLTVTRNYVFDQDAVLGKAEEEALLREEMQRDLVVLILFRLQGR